MPRLKIIAIALSVIGLTVTVPADATENPGRSVRIEHKDLDLGNEKDVRKLERRVARALERVCGSYAMAQEMSDIKRIDKCRADARQTVDPQIANVRKRAETRVWAASNMVDRD